MESSPTLMSHWRVSKKARSLLTRTAILLEDNEDDDAPNNNTPKNQRHRAIGCAVCDEFIIGTEQLCRMSQW
eukprot:scaffold17165_cov124-Skeletonema_marinoi.AAC.1